MIAIVVGILAGIATGWFWGESMTSVAWLGTFFLNTLKMLLVPLIVSSMIVGIAGLGDVRKLGRTGLYTLSYYAATTGIAVLLGIVAVNIIQPGVDTHYTEDTLITEVQSTDATADKLRSVEVSKEGGWVSIILSFVHPNIVGAAADMKILPLIIFALVFGGILTTLEEKGRPVIAFFDGVNEAVMKMVHLIMYMAPIGIFGLIAGRLGQAGGGDAFLAELSKIGGYALTVIIGLLVHAAIVLPLILRYFGGRSPLSYAKGMSKALTTAFSTASSSATLPITIECTEQENRVPRKASLFVLPMGATVNMDGTALYESVAAIFIAQTLDIPLGFEAQLIIFITATLAAIGAAGIPEAGLVTMTIVLTAVGLPWEGIGLILAVDWFLDRCRTTVNVWGDSIGAAVIARLTDAKDDDREAG
jgi:Na+/H+-dicarboxylate symporter